MASGTVMPPPGFVLEQPQQNAGGMNLPPGFQLEQPTAAAPAQQPGPVSRFLSNLWEQVNPISGIKGAAQATAHPIDTLMNDASARKAIYDKAEEAFKKGDYVGGSAHLLYSMTPLLGPSLDKAGEQFASGDIAGGAGASTGIGLNLAGPAALKGATVGVPGAVRDVAQTVAGKMYKSVLKPNVASYSIPEVNGMVQTALDNKIPISEAGLKKLTDLTADVNNAISAKIQSNPTAPISPGGKPLANLADLRDQLSQQVNPSSDLKAVAKAQADFLDKYRAGPGKAVRNMTADEAQNTKVATYQQLSAKYGELGSAQIESQKALTRGIKEELETQFPEIKGLNAQEAKMIDLDGALQRAVRRIENRNTFGLGGTIGAGAGGAAVGLATGSASEGTAAAATVAILHKILTDPMVQSKMAIALNTAAKRGIGASLGKARYAGYVNALGQAVNATSGDSSTSPTTP